MTQLGTESQPLRIAILGSGPAGFYLAEKLFKMPELVVEIDMYDRLPAPFGLVRFGVAPDHEKIKNVTRVFEKVASRPNFRFYGNVEVGKHIRLDALKEHYHQICYATGAQTDRRMGIPGEDLRRSHAATEFVAWYNSHPAYRDCQFDLSAERVAVVGVGNVAVDVARMLCRTREELEITDIADYALTALSESRIKEVYMLGRRGPAQAAFTNPELKELGELPGADIAVVPEETELDPLSGASLDESQDKAILRRMEILQSFIGRSGGDKPCKLSLRFLVSPVELLSDSTGGVAGMRLVKNELYEAGDGTLRPRSTDVFEELSVDMVFRSVGYRGLPVPGLPFDESLGIVPNQKGRVVGSDAAEPIVGLYVAGWIKRGPTGVIGTNKSDAAETVDAMLEDVNRGNVLQPKHPRAEALEVFVRKNQRDLVSFADWQRLNELETAEGVRQGRPRVKFASVEAMMTALKRR